MNSETTTETPTAEAPTFSDDSPSVQPVSEDNVGSPISFLDEDLSTVDTSRPILREGLYDLAVVAAVQDVSKDGKKINLNVKLKTVRNEKTKDSPPQDVAAGFPLRKHTISLSETPEYTQDSIRKAVAEFVQGCNMQRLYPLSQFDGALVTAKVIVEPERRNKETGELYPEGNKIKFFVTPKTAKRK